MINATSNTKTGKFLVILSSLACYLSLVTYPVYAQEDATSSVRDLVRDKIQQQLQTLANKPFAVIGTLAQPSNNGFEVKTADGKTALVSTDKDTKYFQSTKGKKKEVKFEDLTLDEFVIALGYKNGSGVLAAKRIIGYDQSPIKPAREVFLGTVTALSKNSLTVKNAKSQDEKSIKVVSSTSFTGQGEDSQSPSKISFSDIETGNKVAVVGVDDKGNFNADRVHLISGNATPTPSKKPAATPTSTSTITPSVKPTKAPTATPTP